MGRVPENRTFPNKIFWKDLCVLSLSVAPPGGDNMSQPTNACFTYGILPEWTQWSRHPGGPKLKAQFFAKVDVREVIMIDLQGFPTTSQHQTLQNAYDGLRRRAHISESVS